jgi:alcohol dehydrogenase
LPDRIGTVRLPARVHFGYGTRGQIPELVAIHGSRVLVVVDPVLERTPLFATIAGALGAAGLEVRVHADVTPELPVGTLDAGAAAARSARAEVILAVGGGSTLDAAKLIALLVTHGGPLSRYYGENLVPGRVVPVIAAPTTAGTGSEVTPVAVVSDPERELKVGISSPFLVPSAAVVDPELTLGAPAGVTAASGIDALVHAAESYTARELDLDWSEPARVFVGRNELVAPLALEAASRLGPWLPAAVRDGGDRQARREVALGALLGGIAFGSTGTHLCHALQYPLGALTKTPHGVGTGLLLPYVLDAIRQTPDVAERVARLGAALEGLGPDQASAERTVTRVVELNRRIDLPESLAAIGVDRDQLPRIADLALQLTRLLAITPVEPTRELLLEVLERSHAGALSERSLA